MRMKFPAALQSSCSLWAGNGIAEQRNRKLTNPVIRPLLLQRRREYFEASLMKMGMELEATQSVRTAV